MLNYTLAHTDELGDLLFTFQDNIITGLYQPKQVNKPDLETLGDEIPESEVHYVVDQVRSYLKGERTVFNIPVNPEGTDFQNEVWQQLQLIPYGETVTYQELAKRMGRYTATRAVASAVARNPITIIIPCHRVVALIPSDQLKYSAGANAKATLLNIEGHNITPPPPAVAKKPILI